MFDRVLNMHLNDTEWHQSICTQALEKPGLVYEFWNIKELLRCFALSNNFEIFQVGCWPTRQKKIYIRNFSAFIFIRRGFLFFGKIYKTSCKEKNRAHIFKWHWFQTNVKIQIYFLMITSAGCIRTHIHKDVLTWYLYNIYMYLVSPMIYYASLYH